jgi:hypothetical protein
MFRLCLYLEEQTGHCGANLSRHVNHKTATLARGDASRSSEDSIGESLGRSRKARGTWEDRLENNLTNTIPIGVILKQFGNTPGFWGRAASGSQMCTAKGR